MIKSEIYPIYDKMMGRREKERLLGQKGIVVWLLGLSGAGKSTIAIGLERALVAKGYLCALLDGDNIRNGINSDLGFSDGDRVENIRRICEIAKLFMQNGIVTIASFISPTNAIQAIPRRILGDENYFEIFVDTPLEVCESRDVKGLYAKARRGEIKQFSGIDSPFEAPQAADLVLDSHDCGVDELVERIMEALEPRIRINEN